MIALTHAALLATEHKQGGDTDEDVNGLHHHWPRAKEHLNEVVAERDEEPVKTADD